jgi:cytochrome c biogenesis protein CcmG/thiol:disulfide interchange protein DsbE
MRMKRTTNISYYGIDIVRTRCVRLLSLVCALLMAACAQPGSAQSAGAASSATVPPVGVTVGRRAPELELENLEGEQVRLSDLRGQPVMVNFWAVWCGFCRIELPEMQEVYEAYRDQGFIILAVDVQERRSEVKPFVDELGLTFPVLLDSRGEVSRSYRIRGLPTSYFVDQDGVIIGRELGPVDKEWMIEHLAQAGVE